MLGAAVQLTGARPQPHGSARQWRRDAQLNSDNRPFLLVQPNSFSSMSTPNTTLVTVAAVTVLGGLFAYAVYFDHKRRNDIEFRKNLRQSLCLPFFLSRALTRWMLCREGAKACSQGKRPGCSCCTIFAVWPGHRCGYSSCARCTQGRTIAKLDPGA